MSQVSGTRHGQLHLHGLDPLVLSFDEALYLALVAVSLLLLPREDALSEAELVSNVASQTQKQTLLVSLLQLKDGLLESLDSVEPDVLLPRDQERSELVEVMPLVLVLPRP